MKIDEALGIDEEANAVKLVDAVAFARTSIEADAVGEPGATAAQNAEPQAAFFRRDAFLGHAAANLIQRTRGHFDPLGWRLRGSRNSRSCLGCLAQLLRRLNCDEVLHSISCYPRGYCISHLEIRMWGPPYCGDA